MDERHSLMAAIIANPLEDTPRLALADWLQEYGDRHDQARAEFIRCQIAAGQGAPNAAASARRASALRKAHLRHWLGPLIHHQVRCRNITFAFSRGIIHKWIATPSEFLERAHQDAARERFPLLGISELVLHNTTKRVTQLAQSPALDWVSGLWFQDAKIGDDGLTALVRSPFLTKLPSLSIQKAHFSNIGLKALADSTGFPNLRSLHLHDGLRSGRFSASGLHLLLDSPNCPRLDELHLTGSHSPNVMHRSLFQCKNLSRLRSLTLDAGADLMALASCPHLTNLEWFEIGNGIITDASAHTLIANPGFARMTHVGLYSMNAHEPRLSKRVVAALHERFGDGLTLNYADD